MSRVATVFTRDNWLIAMNNKASFSIVPFVAIVALLSAASISSGQETPPLRYQEKTPDETRQMILVYVPDKEKTDGIVSCFSRENASSPWNRDIDDMPAKIGRNGLGEPGEKGEGNGKLPAGEWDLGFAFGFSPDPPEGLKIPYRQITSADFWIDESDAPEYNNWVSGAEPSVSHEKMTAPVVRYNLGLVTLYNVHPIHPGKGSAIFLHVWLNPDHPTAGCVALERDNVVKILQWLDPAKRPRIRAQSNQEL